MASVSKTATELPPYTHHLAYICQPLPLPPPPVSHPPLIASFYGLRTNPALRCNEPCPSATARSVAAFVADKLTSDFCNDNLQTSIDINATLAQRRAQYADRLRTHLDTGPSRRL